MSPGDERATPSDPARRAALRWLATLAATVAGVLGFGGCRRDQVPPPIEVPLADIPAGGRLRVLHGSHPVELRRGAEGGDGARHVAARSLWCTHWGCEVRWSEETQRYLCPCHEGVFDRDGGVVSGPPPRPLAAYPFVIRGESIRIGAET